MLKISYAGCAGLSVVVKRNSLLKCVSQPKLQKTYKTSFTFTTRLNSTSESRRRCRCKLAIRL